MTISRNVRVFGGLVAAAALTVSLAACSQSTPATNAPADDCVPEHQFSTVNEGELAVGVPTFVPFSEIVDGAPSGIDGDIIAEFAAAECLTIKPVPLDYTGLIPGIQQDRIDVAIGSIYRTAARAEQAGVSAPIYLDQMGLISKDGVVTIEEMKSLNVGAIDGNLWVEDLQKALGGKVTVYPSSSELKQDLEAGRLDVAIDSYGASTLVFKDSDYQVKLIEQTDQIKASIEPGQTSYYFNLKAEDFGDALDAKLEQMHDSGKIAEILEKWGLDASAADVGEPRLL